MLAVDTFLTFALAFHLVSYRKLQKITESKIEPEISGQETRPLCTFGPFLFGSASIYDLKAKFRMSMQCLNVMLCKANEELLANFSLPLKLFLKVLSVFISFMQVLFLTHTVTELQSTGSLYYRLLEKYFAQEIIFRSFTYHCVVLLLSFRLHSHPNPCYNPCFAPLFPCALWKSFYFTDNNTDLDVSVNERTKGEQHSDV